MLTSLKKASRILPQHPQQRRPWWARRTLHVTHGLTSDIMDSQISAAQPHLSLLATGTVASLSLRSWMFVPLCGSLCLPRGIPGNRPLG